MRRSRLALLLGGIAFGRGRRVSGRTSRALAWSRDLAVGSVLVVVRSGRPGSAAGEPRRRAHVARRLHVVPRHARSSPPLFLHRGPLVHLLLSYPTGGSPTRLARVVVAAAYVDAAIEPLARERRADARAGRCRRGHRRARVPPRTGLRARPAALGARGGSCVRGGARARRCRPARPAGSDTAVLSGCTTLVIALTAIVLARRSRCAAAGRTPSSPASSSTSARLRRPRPFAASSRARSATLRSSSDTGCRNPRRRRRRRQSDRAAGARFGESDHGDRRPRRALAVLVHDEALLADRQPRRLRRGGGAARGRERAAPGRGTGRARTSSRRRGAASSRPPTRSGGGSSRSSDCGAAQAASSTVATLLAEARTQGRGRGDRRSSRSKPSSKTLAASSASSRTGCSLRR